MGKSATLRTIHIVALAAVTLGSCLLGGCKVVTIEQDRAMRARREGNFDARAYINDIWTSQAVPALSAKTVAAPALLKAIDNGLDRAGRQLGRRVGEDSAWTFVLSGDGTVTHVDTASPHGSFDVVVAGDPKGRPIEVQTGPVVMDSAIRDALPFIAFNDFSDQLAFADVGRALTAKALDRVKPIVGQLHPGAHVRFIGVTNLRAASDPIVVTPVSLALVGPGRTS